MRTRDAAVRDDGTVEGKSSNGDRFFSDVGPIRPGEPTLAVERPTRATGAAPPRQVLRERAAGGRGRSVLALRAPVPPRDEGGRSGRTRGRSRSSDRLIHSPAVPGEDPDLAVLVDDLEVVTPELDQLRRRRRGRGACRPGPSPVRGRGARPCRPAPARPPSVRGRRSPGSGRPREPSRILGELLRSADARSASRVARGRNSLGPSPFSSSSSAREIVTNSSAGRPPRDSNRGT